MPFMVQKILRCPPFMSFMSYMVQKSGTLQ
jgi:hypothetical protein